MPPSVIGKRDDSTRFWKRSPMIRPRARSGCHGAPARCSPRMTAGLTCSFPRRPEVDRLKARYADWLSFTFGSFEMNSVPQAHRPRCLDGQLCSARGLAQGPLRGRTAAGLRGPSLTKTPGRAPIPSRPFGRTPSGPHRKNSAHPGEGRDPGFFRASAHGSGKPSLNPKGEPLFQKHLGPGLRRDERCFRDYDFSPIARSRSSRNAPAVTGSNFAPSPTQLSSTASEVSSVGCMKNGIE